MDRRTYRREGDGQSSRWMDLDQRCAVRLSCCASRGYYRCSIWRGGLGFDKQACDGIKCKDDTDTPPMQNFVSSGADNFRRLI